MIRNFGASGLTKQVQGLDLGLGGGSNIKNIQRGTASIINGGINVNITISSVDLSKTLLIFSIRQDNTTNDPSACLARGYINASTNIKFERGSAPAKQILIDWQVIEFNGNVKVQNGLTALNDGVAQNTITISSVDLTKAVLFHSVTTSAASQTFADVLTSGYLSSNTGVTFRRINSYLGNLIAWYVVEFL